MYVAEASRGDLPMGGAFAPARMRIHPLSHVDAPAGVGPRVVLHVDFEDRFGHPVKAAGAMQIKLLEPERRANGASELDDVSRRWEPAFTDLAANSQLYDPTTRTYRIELGGLPEWAQAYARGQDDRAGIELVVEYEGLDAAGDAFVLTSRADVRR